MRLSYENMPIPKILSEGKNEILKPQRAQSNYAEIAKTCQIHDFSFAYFALS
jgi:hypothetical protein